MFWWERLSECMKTGRLGRLTGCQVLKNLGSSNAVERSFLDSCSMVEAFWLATEGRYVPLFSLKIACLVPTCFPIMFCSVSSCKCLPLELLHNHPELTSCSRHFCFVNVLDRLERLDKRIALYHLHQCVTERYHLGKINVLHIKLGWGFHQGGCLNDCFFNDLDSFSMVRKKLVHFVIYKKWIVYKYIPASITSLNCSIFSFQLAYE